MSHTTARLYRLAEKANDAEHITSSEIATVCVAAAREIERLHEFRAAMIGPANIAFNMKQQAEGDRERYEFGRISDAMDAAARTSREK